MANDPGFPLIGGKRSLCLKCLWIKLEKTEAKAHGSGGICGTHGPGLTASLPRGITGGSERVGDLPEAAR